MLPFGIQLFPDDPPPPAPSCSHRRRPRTLGHPANLPPTPLPAVPVRPHLAYISTSAVRSGRRGSGAPAEEEKRLQREASAEL
ncbi:hypothetical protein GUJ93_ZPchr0001g33138 [Zizania palustris]|uniref:Uncharacterized protein n=1 Tax=Zizania palustris TaxID=103762 RepID=A0A8J5VMG0_ZIZPA|nr:hypothetical protein GUJ93_ZPchr0001g33138 [Zizania palustris]